MTREIKFEAWHELKKTMFSWDDISIIGRNNCVIHISKGVFPTDGFENCVILRQFTGLKDKNGKEIFEGDIIQFTYWWFDGEEQQSILTGELIYSEDSISFQLKGVKNSVWEKHNGYQDDCEYLVPFATLNFDEADFEVIGNIYENPELLDKTE